MAKGYDITFTLDEGKVYHFMLAGADGSKAWRKAPIYAIPPSLLKHRIDMNITATEQGTTLSGAQQIKRAAEILTQLEEILNETEYVTLLGYDDHSYKVLLDREGVEIVTVIDEVSRAPEYQVKVVCWSFYHIAELE